MGWFGRSPDVTLLTVVALVGFGAVVAITWWQWPVEAYPRSTDLVPGS